MRNLCRVFVDSSSTIHRSSIPLFLLGLIREDQPIAARVLTNLGVELKKIRSAVEFLLDREGRLVLNEIKLTPCVKKVVELAADEAHRLHHPYIGTEHLLLGLVREGEGIAARDGARLVAPKRK
jgi:ATP-dependent Clp protease ATP-binding subunit ClpC